MVLLNCLGNPNHRLCTLNSREVRENLAQVSAALDDSEVFAPLFQDRNTWAVWRAFLASLFALPMSNDQLATYRECTGRNSPPTRPAKEAWLVVGRKGGKSRMLALIATFLAAFIDWRKFLSVGERGVVMVVAQDRDAAQWIMQYISGNFHSVPMLEQLIEREATDLQFSSKRPAAGSGMLRTETSPVDATTYILIRTTDHTGARTWMANARAVKDRMIGADSGAWAGNLTTGTRLTDAGEIF